VPQQSNAEPLVGHRCTYQNIDIDIAGCLYCGHIHVCDVLKCVTVNDESHAVCPVTGYCVRERMYSTKEYTENVCVTDHVGLHETQIVHDDAVYCYVAQMLLSDKAKQSMLHEHEKWTQKHQYVLFRLMKEYKMNNPGKMPNILYLVTCMLNKSANIRQCSSTFDIPLRESIARYCTKIIARILTILLPYFSHSMIQFKQKILTIGLLYLMRVGIEVHNITLLPRVPILNTLLPLETHLFTHFNIRCKSITEVENVIKIHVRLLNKTQVQRMGLEHIDEILS
jgi:hypothetical protein